MRRFASLMAAAGAVVVVGVSAGAAAASPVASAASTIPHLKSPSASGYAAVPGPTGAAQTFTHVQVSFTVPSVICPGSASGAVAQQRAGLGGLTNGVIEQVGISEACQNGTAPYTAWYQMSPAGEQVLFDPNPGDKVNLSVTVAGGVYTFVVDDVTTGKGYSTTAPCATVCDDSSAQVTAGSPAPLRPASFGTVHFNNIVATDSAGASGGLTNPGWDTIKLIQTGRPHTVAGPLSTSSAPIPPHSSFADHWAP